MTTCTETDCGGTIATDGYCDTCGAKATLTGAAPSGPSAQPSVPGAPSAGTAAGPVIGGSCGRGGCTGTIASDGYCDTCGLAVASSGGPGSAGVTAGTYPGRAHSASTEPSIAAPEAPDTSTRIRGAGTETAQSRRTITSIRTRSTRTGIGAGLVNVAPTPEGDPARAVMGEDKIRSVLGEVPEEERHCSSCGRPVGQSVDGKPGRVKGFCGTCRTAFDFVTNEPALQNGELVAGQYQILGPLAHGGMGWIYLGQDKAVSDRWVVLKGLLNESDPDAIIAAVAERQFLAQIEHANIVNIYNFVTHRGAGYIVMEMVGGESLNAKLKRRREANGGIADPLPPPEAIAYILGILPAFGYLHELGLVYNDLKPANIMAVGDEVKLIDVGAVMRIDDHDAAIFGTQGFQAPEVATTGPSVASDLYTVGRTLAVLLIRFVFHDGPYLYALPGRDSEPLFAQWESLHRFLLRACAFHADDRFQTAAEMGEQLTGVLREMVAVIEAKPRTVTSSLFEGDQLANLLMTSADGYDVTHPDWRVLPSSRVNEADPAAPFLLGLPEQDPARAIDLLDAGVIADQVEATPELHLHRAREMVGAQRDPNPSLVEVERANPWEWRAIWYRSIHQLQIGQAAQAAEGFSKVWTELPGESAPKLAVALAAELAGEYDRAAEVYELVISADASYVSAAFGLARCEHHQGDAEGVVDAFGRVPASSAAHYDAQVATARALVSGGPSGQPSVAELQAASATIERLQLDVAERALLSADVYERALAGVKSGTIPPGSSTMLGREL
ncbi:MAG: protein kinase, partial [Actinomycetia bacterium]|nr:protein kinase [Actinomycetes bacterium]